MKKVLSTILAALLAAGALSACQSAPASSGTESTPESKAEESTAEESKAEGGDAATSDITLTYWSMWNSTEPQATAIQEAIEAYTAETGIQVEVQWNGRDTQQQTIQAALPAAVRNWAGELIAIPSYSEHPQEAFDLITKIPSGEFDEKMAMASNGIPADTRNEEWPEMLAGVREAFNVQTGVYDWNCGLNENGDLGTAFQDPAAKLFEGSLDGQGFVEAMDALY